MKDFKIAPSILAADLARLGEEVENVLKAGADIVHFDVMDNHYVPNLTFGPAIAKSLDKYLSNAGIDAPLDIHLMVEPVDDLIKMFADAGATYITFHPEASRHVDRSINLIRELGCQPGLVLNPASSIDSIRHVLPELDMLLLMSVNPGFGGQKFIPYVLDKVKQARALIDGMGLDMRLEIDGGVTCENIREVAAAGADTFVAGSAIFGQEDYTAVIETMRAELASVNLSELK